MHRNEYPHEKTKKDGTILTLLISNIKSTSPPKNKNFKLVTCHIHHLEIQWNIFGRIDRSIGRIYLEGLTLSMLSIKTQTDTCVIIWYAFQINAVFNLFIKKTEKFHNNNKQLNCFKINNEMLQRISILE